MKKSLATLALASAALLVGGCTQEQKTASTTDPYVEFARADLRSQRREMTRDWMRLSATEFSAFWPIYDQFEAENRKLWDDALAMIKDYGRAYPNPSNDQAHDLIRKWGDIQSRRVALKSDYAKKVENALDPVSAARFLQVSNRVDTAADVELMTYLPALPSPAR